MWGGSARGGEGCSYYNSYHGVDDDDCCRKTTMTAVMHCHCINILGLGCVVLGCIGLGCVGLGGAV